MERTVYVNGKFVSELNAKVSIFDRGFLFADGVYEVTAVIDGKLVDWEYHFERLSRSLQEIKLNFQKNEAQLVSVHRELVRRNEISSGLVYLQITRGSSDRDFIIKNNVKPTIILFTQKIDLLEPRRLHRRLRVTLEEDIRWGRCDVKTIQLLGSSLIKSDAKKRGYDDAWLVSEGCVTEGTSSNAFIISSENTIITRSLSNKILSGITRSALLKSAAQLGLTVEERPFSVQEAKRAKEAFITSASNFIVSVVEIDGAIIGSGEIGCVTKSLQKNYLAYIKNNAI